MLPKRCAVRLLPYYYIRELPESTEVIHMENIQESIFEMFETILKIAGMIVTGISTIVKAVDLVDRFTHRKSNRPSPK